MYVSCVRIKHCDWATEHMRQLDLYGFKFVHAKWTLQNYCLPRTGTCNSAKNSKSNGYSHKIPEASERSSFITNAGSNEPLFFTNVAMITEFGTNSSPWFIVVMGLGSRSKYCSFIADLEAVTNVCDNAW